AASALAAITISPIPQREGFLVRQALLDRFPEGSAARYTLDIRLDDDITGFGIRGDDAITRERRTLRARWTLTEIETGQVIIDATSRSDAGIDVVSSDYAVVAAENTALERLSEEIAADITQRIALRISQRAAR
ncbi:MAG: LPS assembly lipoprotein LptE, partial [Pacificimonas sp.]|nr:LPS assembly lipoprotein LptE [Pacificimonas sp.]